ncbi:MAG TPA: divergent polysaccharide deacetylase family protein, partial [Chondromyces sp.]|nr:divergent polysaccharide deacetylase family protein [Chondromyces sp.]
DNKRQAAAIRRQLDEAVYRCRMEGEAIAIGHLDEVTLQVLAEDLPGISDRGADLVKPSEMTK